MKSLLTASVNIQEATDMVQSLLKERSGADNVNVTIDIPVQMTGESFSLDKPIPQSVLTSIMANPQNKIGHIKDCRAVTGWGLKESKDYIEHLHYKFFNGARPFALQQ